MKFNPFKKLLTVAAVGVAVSSHAEKPAELKSLEKDPSHTTTNSSQESKTVNNAETADFSVEQEIQRKIQELHKKIESLEREKSETEDSLEQDKKIQQDMFEEFSILHGKALAHLDHKDAKKFSAVAQLPNLIEKDVTGFVNSPEHVKRSLTTVEAKKFLEDHVQDFANKLTGPTMQTMFEVKNSNNLGGVLITQNEMAQAMAEAIGSQSADIDTSKNGMDHGNMRTGFSEAVSLEKYFNEFPKNAVEIITKIITEKRAIDNLEKGIAQYEDELKNYLDNAHENGSLDIAEHN